MKIRDFYKRILIGTAVVAALLFFAFPPKQRFMMNLTDSVPVGLYLMHYDSSIGVGDLVAFPPIGNVGEMMRSRNYISDSTPLIKIVAGVQGDEFCIDSNRNFIINGKTFGVALDADSKGQPLPRINGCATVGSEDVLVVGHSHRSFDSRYFGTVSKKIITAKLSPIWLTSPEKKPKQKTPANEEQSRGTMQCGFGREDGVNSCRLVGRQDKALLFFLPKSLFWKEQFWYI